MPVSGRRVPNRVGGGAHPATITHAPHAAAAVGRTAPVLVQYAETSWSTLTGSQSTTTNISWQAGDWIVIVGGTEVNTTSINTPTATGLTFTPGTPLAVGSSCWANTWTANPGTSGGPVAVAATTTSSVVWGIGVWVYRGSDGPGARASGATTAKTISLALSNSNSAVVEGVFDFSAGAPTSHVWTPTGQTERQAIIVGSNYTAYVANWPDQGAQATTSYGITGTASGGVHSKVALEILGTGTNPGATGQPLIVTGPPWPLTIPVATVTSSQPLGNPATGSPRPLVTSPPFAWPTTPTARLFAAPAPATVVTAATTPQPLIVFTGPAWPLTTPNPVLGAPSQSGAPSPLIVTPTAGWPPVPPVLLSASQPLGNPAVGTPGPLVISTPWSAKVPGALLSANPAPQIVVATGTPQPLVVTPPAGPPPVPPPFLSASQPLGNPAVPTPQPLVVSTPWTVRTPGPLITGNPALPPPIVTGSTPGPLVVGPPFIPVPVPPTFLSASQPIGNPAVGTPPPLVVGLPPAPPVLPRPTLTAGAATTASGQPLVVGQPFTLAPVPGAHVFANPAAPAQVSTTGTPGPILVTPPWQPVPIPRTYLSASLPLGRPAAATPQPLLVLPPQRWPVWTAALITMPPPIPVVVTSCDTPRPNTGATARPNSGITAWSQATTARPNSGVTTRPNTGDTPPPCGP